MLRLLLVVLLLVNGLLLAAQWGVFGPPGGAAGQREPERLLRQVRPDAVQIVSAPAASAAQAALVASAPASNLAAAAAGASAAAAVAATTVAATATPASALLPAAAPAGPASQASAAASASAAHPASAVPAAAPASKAGATPAPSSAASAATAASTRPVANSAAPSCLQAGPFAAADAETAQRTLQNAGLPAGSWQALTSDGGGAYMVYMGRYTDPKLLQRKHDELARRKVVADDLRDIPALQPGLSLGRFETREDADAALARFAKRGVRTARVLTLQQAQAQTLLRLPAADATLRARVAGLRLPSGPGFVACAAALPVNAASAPR